MLTNNTVNAFKLTCSRATLTSSSNATPHFNLNNTPFLAILINWCVNEVYPSPVTTQKLEGHTIMPNLRPTELIIILLIIVLLFGAKKLPELAKSIGQSMRFSVPRPRPMTRQHNKPSIQSATAPAPAPAAAPAPAPAVPPSRHDERHRRPDYSNRSRTAMSTVPGNPALPAPLAPAMHPGDRDTHLDLDDLIDHSHEATQQASAGAQHPTRRWKRGVGRKSKTRKPRNPDAVMPLADHLVEFRKRFVRAIAGIIYNPTGRPGRHHCHWYVLRRRRCWPFVTSVRLSCFRSCGHILPVLGAFGSYFLGQVIRPLFCRPLVCMLIGYYCHICTSLSFLLMS